MFYLFLFLLILFVIPFILCPKPRNHHDAHYDCILVLGCPTYDNGEPTPSLMRRLSLANDLYHSKSISCFILSGGSVKNLYCEAEVMEEQLRNTCPLAKYYLDKQANNTFENFKYAKLICDQQGFRKIAIVSDASHIRRSAFFARKFFSEFDFYGASEPFSLKKKIREFLALYNTLYYELKLKSTK